MQLSTQSSETLPCVKLLSQGRWIDSNCIETDRWDDVYNPSTGQVIARVPLCGAAEVDGVVSSAAAAFPAWSDTPVVERARLMFRYRELLEANFHELSQLVTREHGKTMAEARAEVRRGIEVVEFACGIPSLVMGRCVANIADDIDAETCRHPLGVCVGITPYNFPAMVPLWMFPIALVCGNTFILKPSEKTPLSAVRLGELLIEAGCPAGVFNIVHGGSQCAGELIDHPQTAAISFVGSTPVAKAIYEASARAGKRCQAAGGAKNHFIILPDADPELVIPALSASAFGCAGQRCMATSVAITVGEIGDPLVERFSAHAAALRVGPTDGFSQDEVDVDVGPLIRREHKARVAAYLETAAEEGATIALDGRSAVDGRRAAAHDDFLLGPSIVDRVDTSMRVWREEIFGPVLSVVRVANLDEALAIGRECSFGNGASIFTRDGYAAREFKRHYSAGMIGVNVGVPAPMAWFPFTGWNGSFFGDLHMQGMEGVQFYTRQKVSLTRWFRPQESQHHDPLLKGDLGGWH
jgi:malonate-semialdehyde dehydrogenase (acetylating)/methylmalonate-semialdehyde dehydrogenase